MRNVVSVWTRWGDYVLGVRDLQPAEAASFGSLSAGQRLTVERDGLQYCVTCFEVDDALGFTPPRRWLAAGGAAVVAGALVGVLALLFVPRVAAVVPTPTPALMPASSAHAAAMLPETPPVHAGVFAEANEPQPQPLKPPGDSRCGLAEMGELVAESRGRYGLAGPKDNADPHLARPVPGRGYQTATAFDISGGCGLARTPPGSVGPTAPFGRDAALGTDETNARGRIWGDEIEAAPGERGLGLAAHAGGIVKSIDVAPFADNAPAALRVVHTGLRVTGARKASEIGRAMAAHFDDFRHCAEAAELGEARRVELDFDVAADGRASATPANVGALEQCLDRTLASVAFSADVNAPAHVVYPLYFMPAMAELRTPPVERQRPAACDCGG